MIGKITTGESFYHCLSYCLQDKKGLSEQQKILLSVKENVQHKDRAEVLFYNKCFGNARELANQFTDVGKLSRRVEKPVLHIMLSLAPGEQLSKHKLEEIGRACAEAFKIDQNQYVCILHKDSRLQHIHIVANRVGYDGRAATLSNNYRRIANFCREMEKKHDLTQVLNPRVFQAQVEQRIPRQDARKVKFKSDIKRTLTGCLSYSEFEQKMKSLGYEVLKGRGVSFIDQKKVKVKGSEVGFSLMTIEKIISANNQKKVDHPIQKSKEEQWKEMRNQSSYTPGKAIEKDLAKSQDHSIENNRQEGKNNLLYELMKSERQEELINPFLLQKKRKRKKYLRPKF
jgi:hypothetical protein